MSIKRRTCCILTLAVPRHSACLAKKATNRTPAVVAAQSLLVCKLGFLQAQNEIQSTNFDRYIQLFAEGLKEEQAQAIMELFMDHVPPPELAESVDVVEE
jgi:hypothetical protein